MADVTAAMFDPSGLSIVRQQDGGDKDHYLVLIDQQCVGTVREVVGGFRPDGMEGHFTDFGSAVVHVATSTASRKHHEAVRITDVLLQTLSKGPVVMPKVTK